MLNEMLELKPGTVVEMKNGEKFLLIKSADDGIIGWNLTNVGNFGSGFDFNFVDKIFVVKKAAYLTDDNLELIWQRKPDTDWSKVAVNTKILVKYFQETDWHKVYFARIENGEIFAWSNGRDSFTAKSYNDVSLWDKAILYEGNESLVGE